jgi:pimeloyl-ACP methyl ester carboxylesterase
VAPNARAAIVEDAGHAPHLQRPDEVARLIEAFLNP